MYSSCSTGCIGIGSSVNIENNLSKEKIPTEVKVFKGYYYSCTIINKYNMIFSMCIYSKQAYFITKRRSNITIHAFLLAIICLMNCSGGIEVRIEGACEQDELFCFCSLSLHIFQKSSQIVYRRTVYIWGLTNILRKKTLEYFPKIKKG